MSDKNSGASPLIDLKTIVDVSALLMLATVDQERLWIKFVADTSYAPLAKILTAFDIAIFTLLPYPTERFCNSTRFNIQLWQSSPVPHWPKFKSRKHKILAFGIEDLLPIQFLWIEHYLVDGDMDT